MLGLFLKTKALLVTDPTFEEYSTREKILAIFYTWFEILGQEREFLTTLEKIQPWARTASLWNKVKPAFVDWIGEIIDEGVENREIAGRIVLSSWYKHVIWMQAMAILSSWLYDKSEEFARTDALIEKSITFLFDLIQPNALDSGWDLVSFFVKK
ncbi:MAG: TetR family transcriptional regulator C-terminal domain-containing protein [Bacteroidia bacterium]|nr:TetR family transcriptional regulator C-terminal domain-containing protein [Bacteroidia bacterium]